MTGPVRNEANIIRVEGIPYIWSDQAVLNSQEELLYRSYSIRFAREPDDRIRAMEGRDSYAKLRFFERPYVLLMALTLALITAIVFTCCYFLSRSFRLKTSGWLAFASLTFIASCTAILVGLSVSGNVSFGLSVVYYAGTYYFLLAGLTASISIFYSMKTRRKLRRVSCACSILLLFGVFAAAEVGLMAVPFS